MSSINEILLITLPHFPEENGDLTFMEVEKHVPFNIERVFVVRANSGSIRGEHAHKLCKQYLTCPYGSVEVVCDDGFNKSTYILDNPKIALMIPEGIWAHQIYIISNSVLTVLCNRKYEPEDYIRNYDKFLNYKNKNL